MRMRQFNPDLRATHEIQDVSRLGGKLNRGTRVVLNSQRIASHPPSSEGCHSPHHFSLQLSALPPVLPLAQRIGVGNDDMLKKPSKTPATTLMFKDLM
jgi:hypothetical protein